MSKFRRGKPQALFLFSFYTISVCISLFKEEILFIGRYNQAYFIMQLYHICWPAVKRFIVIAAFPVEKAIIILSDEFLQPFPGIEILFVAIKSDYIGFIRTEIYVLHSSPHRLTIIDILVSFTRMDN